MEDKKGMSVKEIVEKDENRFRAIYDFIKEHLKTIIIVLMLFMVAATALHYYNEYRIRKEVEKLVEEKVQEIINEKQDDVTQSEIPEIIFNYDMKEMLETLDIEKIKEYVENNPELNEILTDEQMKELMDILKGMTSIEDFFDTYSSDSN